MAFAIAVENLKIKHNLGTLMRSAVNFGAAAVFTIGRRYRRVGSDTMNAGGQIPIINFLNWTDYREHALNWMHIGVEIKSRSTNIIRFVHPDQVVYLLGPEDGSLSKEAQSICKYIVEIPTDRCLNLAVAASVVMYDRHLKGIINGKSPKRISNVVRQGFHGED